MVTINTLPSAPTIQRQDFTCSYAYVAANAGDTFDPPSIPTVAPGQISAPLAVMVTNINGCTASFSVPLVACPAAFTVDNNFSAADPCSCNGDQVLNADGSVATVGTFEETVTLTGPPGLQVQIGAAIGMLNPMTALTETPANSGIYQVTFNHADRTGYAITEFVFSVDGGVTFNTVTESDGLTPITISNVCAYPRVVCDPVIPSPILTSDPPITLGVRETSTDISFTALPGYPIFTLNGSILLQYLIPLIQT